MQDSFRIFVKAGTKLSIENLLWGNNPSWCAYKFQGEGGGGGAKSCKGPPQMKPC